MPSEQRPVTGHPPRRALRPIMRVSNLFQFLQSAALRRRGKIAGRFRGPYDWRRLLALGIILIDLAIIALACSAFDRIISGYWPGMSSIFGGLLLAIIIIRLGSPALYLDWIASGLLHIGLGLLLAKDPFLASSSSFALFCVLLACSALLLTWIGVTFDIPGGRAWLTAGGLASLHCVAWAVVARFTILTVEPDIVLAVVLLLLGMSIAGFGFSLRGRGT